MIKRAIIDKFISKYDLRHIINFLDSNNKLTKDINYNNYDQIYPEIFRFLNEKQPDYIKKIKQFKIPEELKFKKNEGTFTQKELFGLPKIKYFDDFEIIDQKFGLFLKEIFKNDLELLESNCLAANNKIFREYNIKTENNTYNIRVELFEDNISFIFPNNIDVDQNEVYSMYNNKNIKILVSNEDI